jgi:hypothetical protein
MPRTASLAFTIILITTALTACGPRRLTLPTGPGTPATDHAAILVSASARCRDVRSLQGELSLSGRAGRQAMRGRVLAGLVPGALRLEGVAPFGSPVFIFVADGPRGTLLRDRRILQEAPPDEILDALVGVRLGPDDLRAVLSGCVKPSLDAASGREYGPDWRSVVLASGGTVYLQRQSGSWRIVAGRDDRLAVEYTRFAGDLPAEMQIVGAGLNLGIGLSQIDTTSVLPRDELVALKVPAGLSPITLDELRDAGPLGPRD